MIIFILATAAFADSVFSVRAAGAFDFILTKTPKSATTKPSYADSFDHVVLKTPGLGFDAGIGLKLSDSIVLYGDFSMTFPSEIKYGSEAYTKKENEDNMKDEKNKCEEGNYLGINFTDVQGNAFMTSVSAHLGFAKRVTNPDSLFNVELGGGVGYSRASTGFRMTMKEVKKIDEENYETKLYHLDDYDILSELSLDLYINAEYKLGDHISVGGTIIPGFVFFSSSKVYCTTIDFGAPYGYVRGPVESDKYYSTSDADFQATGMKPKYENSGFSTGFSLNTAIGVTFHF